MLRRMIGLVTTIAIVFSMTGCWDRIEVEERGFVIGTAIDTASEKDVKNTEETGGLTTEKRPEGQVPFLVTVQMLSLSGSATKKEGGGSGAQGEFFNVTSVGETVLQAIRELAERVARTPYFGHNQILIISEEVASSTMFGSVLDVFLRDHEIKRSLNVYISEGEARNILDIKPDDNQVPSQYIQSVAGNSYKTSRMLQDVRLADLHQYLLEQTSFVLPRIAASETEVKIGGAAVFSGKDNRMVGFLNEDETKGLNFVLGHTIGGYLTAVYEDNLISFEIKNAHRKITADVSNPDNIKFTIHIETDGALAEKFTKLNLLDDRVIDGLQKQISDEIKRLVNLAAETLQFDMKTDALGLYDFLRQNHYDVWKQLKGNWDSGKELFTKCDIHVSAKTTILNRGTINQSH